MLTSTGEMDIVSVSFTWRINNFCNDNKIKKQLYSPVFITDHLKWQLQFDNFKDPENTSYNSLFLYSRNDFPITLLANLSILDDENKKLGTRTILENSVLQPNQGGGWKDFIEEQLILSKNKKILANDTLTILCEIIISNRVYKDLKDSEQSNLLREKTKNFSEYLNKKEFSDVILLIDGEKIPAHKILLAMKSPVFKAMFCHDETVDYQLNEVEITDVKLNVLEQMLHFIYDEHSFQIESEESAEQLLIAADRYEISELIEKCEKYFSDKLHVGNIIKIVKLAISCNADYLKGKALDYISMHSKKIQNTPEYKSLDSDLKAEIMDAFSGDEHSSE